MVKNAMLLLLLFMAQIIFAQKATFNILKHKTTVDGIGAITLFVEVTNKSKEEITILKPATDYHQKWMFYSSSVKCENFPIWDSNSVRYMEYTESDLLVIPAKSKAMIIVDGRKNGDSLSCYSENFQIKLSYDPSSLIENKKLTNAEMELVKKLTPIKIESKETRVTVL